MIAITTSSHPAIDVTPTVPSIIVPIDPALAFLRAIAELPSLNQSFHDLAIELIASGGKVGFTAAGGTLRADNWLEFDDPSSVGTLVQANLIGSFGGFHYRDEHRMPWVYRVVDPKPDRFGHWDALAIGCDCLADAFQPTIRLKFLTELRQRFEQRCPVGSKSIDRVESGFHVQQALATLRSWDQAPRLLPVLCKTAVASGLQEFSISKEELANLLLGSSCKRPYDWRERVVRALKTLADGRIYRMQLSTRGWNPQQVSSVPAISLLSFDDHVRVRLEPDFVRFLEPCFPAVAPGVTVPVQASCTLPQLPSTDNSSAKMETSQTHAMATNPDPAASQLTLTPVEREAMIVERVFPAAVLATMSNKSLGKSVSQAGYLEYLNQLIADACNPADPIQRMMLEQLAWAHCRLGQLHAEAACATSTEVQVTLTIAAARLSSEFRKSALGLKELQRPAKEGIRDAAPMISVPEPMASTATAAVAPQNRSGDEPRTGVNGKRKTSLPQVTGQSLEPDPLLRFGAITARARPAKSPGTTK